MRLGRWMLDVLRLPTAHHTATLHGLPIQDGFLGSTGLRSEIDPEALVHFGHQNHRLTASVDAEVVALARQELALSLRALATREFGELLGVQEHSTPTPAM